MAREDGFEDATDPGEPTPVASVSEEEAEDEFPDAQIIVDEETGQHFIAFEIEPPEEESEEEESK